MSMSITVQGLDETIAKLRDLSVAVGDRLVEAAGRAALKPIVADVRTRVAVDKGALKKSIGTKKAKRQSKGVVVLSVGARPGFNYKDADGKNVDPFFYALPWEYGHAVVVHGQTVGHVMPAGVFRSAYERGRVKVVDDFQTELNERIEAHLAKMA